MEVVREPKKSMDSILLFLVLLLVVWGLIFLYSTSAYNGRVKFHDPAYYFKKQLFATSLGLIAMYLVSCIDYHIAVKFAPLFYLASMGLSLAVLLFGQEYNGSKRWLSIGPFSFQPSEFAKAAVILFLTFLITNSQKKKDGIFWMAGIMLPLLPIVGLVGTNNLSTAIIILGIGVILVFISHPRYLPFIGIGVAGTVFIAIFLGAASYRLERLKIWRNPEAYFGSGLGSSVQKLGFVPEAQNDMIFSIICEETGLCGAVLLIMLFALLIWRLMVIATHAGDLEGALISGGIMGHIAIQVILNIAVVTNTIPNTGITLPFVSYGGTSVVFLLGEMGMALAVSRRGKRESR